MEDQEESPLKGRSIRLSEDVWRALSEMRFVKNRIVSWEVMFNVLLDKLYFKYGDYKYGDWREKKEKGDEDFFNILEIAMEDMSDDEGKVESSEAMKRLGFLNENKSILNPPYEL